MDEPVRVAIANDYEIVVEGLRALLRPYEPDLCVAELAPGSVPHETVDVTLFDTYGQRGTAYDHARMLVEAPNTGAVVVFSFSARPWPDSTLEQLGVDGFIAKSAPVPEIVDGLRAAAAGSTVRVRHSGRTSAASPHVRWPGRDRGLTDRESELLALLPTGMTNSELAQQLFVSENTVKSQLRGLFSKLGVRNRTQAAALADGEHGILGRRTPS